MAELEELDYFKGMSKEDIVDYLEAEKQIAEERDKQIEADGKILAIVEKEVPPDHFENIKWAIEESENAGNYRIVAEPIGDLQTIDGFEEWVDQHAVGDSGDCWAGTCCMKISEGRYLAWDYCT